MKLFWKDCHKVLAIYIGIKKKKNSESEFEFYVYASFSLRLTPQTPNLDLNHMFAVVHNHLWSI